MPEMIIFKNVIFSVWEGKIGIIDWKLQNLLKDNDNSFSQYSKIELAKDGVGLYISEQK